MGRPGCFEVARDSHWGWPYDVKIGQHQFLGHVATAIFVEVPMYRLFHDGEVPAGLSKMKPPKDDDFGRKGAEADYVSIAGTVCPFSTREI
jgi:hypothetical protein